MKEAYNNKQLLPTPVSPIMMYLNRYAYEDMARRRAAKGGGGRVKGAREEH